VVATEQKVSLTGAGATFPYPLYSKWISEYGKANPNVRINYQSIGSGAGIRQIIAETVDFGASDAPMKDEEAKDAKGKLVHIPTTLGAVVLAYNLPGVKLRLDAQTITGIFLGDITKWNDAVIKALNPEASLPDTAIVPTFRSDGSGTTAVFTDYLAGASPVWKEKVGQGKSVSWPKGLGAKGNEGVTGQVKTTPGALGYIEAVYAEQNKLSVAELKNPAGNFVTATGAAVTAAAEGVQLPDTLYASITNSPQPGAYPIAAYTYLLVYEDAKDAAKGKAIAKFAWWALTDGQAYAADLNYAPLPASVAAKVKDKLKTLHHGGQGLL
jgi:phosphate transport system substrate-binding protein